MLNLPTATQRVGALLFCYFATVGALSPYLSLYLSAQGHSIERIGVLMALPQLMRIFGPPFWGWLADLTQRHALLLRVSAMANLLLMALLPSLAQSYVAVFVLLLLLYFANAAQGPLGELFTLSISGSDSGRYGRIRLWGSIGFLLAVTLVGPLLDAVGTQYLPHAVVALSVPLLLVVWSLPQRASVGRGTPSGRIRSRLVEPAVALFFLASFLMIFAHGALYAFFSLYLERHGYSKTAIGLIWSVGVLAEIVVFRFQSQLFGRFGAARLLSASLLTAGLRFALIAVSGGGLALLLLTQIGHALTFGVHHSASMAYLQKWFSPEQQGRAQAMYVTIAYGLGGTSGGLIASALWTQISPSAAFGGASIAGFAAWLVFAICRKYEPRSVPGPNGHASGQS